MKENIEHIPVLKNEVITLLNPDKNQNFIDCTIGGGGHAKEILIKTAPQGVLLGIDLSKEALEETQKKLIDFKDRIIFLEQENFTNLENIVEKFNLRKINGILFDLGLSDYLLLQSGRGFSFRKNEILDMRFNPEVQKTTAADLLNNLRQEELQKIFWEFGEEFYGRKVAREIVKRRKNKKFETTTDLVSAILRAKPRKRKGAHPARKVFQALRISVNDELENLKIGLSAAVKILSKNGKIAVISFHSLEDRIVKNFFKEKAQQEIVRIITKKPVRPIEKEIKNNPKSRSAKLRVAEKI